MSKKIFCLIGKSSSGKDSIKSLLLKKCEYLDFMVPLTTRPMRVGETDGYDYHFLTNDDFFNKLNTNILLEHRKYDVVDSNNNKNVWYYGHTKPESDISLMIGTLDVYGAIRQNPDYIVYPIFIHIPDEIRLCRMITRELESDEPNIYELSRRFVSDLDAFTYDRLIELDINNRHIKKVFINNDLETVSNEIANHINNLCMVKTER